MGKQTGKKKQSVGNLGDGAVRQSRAGASSPRAYDKDTAVFIAMSQELKEEGNRFFQKKDYEGAMLKYEKALKLLPRVHIDVSYLRSNMAACYMQMGVHEYPRAIHECNLALEVTPKYSKALLKRARCYEALNRLDLALRDTNTVLNMEPNNLMALEISERVKEALEKKGLQVSDTLIELPPDYVEPPIVSPLPKVVKEKKRKMKKRVQQVEKEDTQEETKEEIKKHAESHVEEKTKKTTKRSNKEKPQEKKADDKVVVEEKIMDVKEEVPKRNVKLVFGEDIRWAQLPYNCSLAQVREVVCERFPSSRAVLLKYRDEEGDLVTITTDEELRWAEASAESQGSIRLYLVQVSPDQDPFFSDKDEQDVNSKHSGVFSENGDAVKCKEVDKQPTCINDWIVHFAQLFKNYVGLDSDEYLDLHELGMKLYSEAMEETVTSDEAQGLFEIAGEKFQEMAALALFNWGNVHMSRARKGVYLAEDASEEAMLAQIKNAFDWAQDEYKKAGRKYEEALKIKPDFYEGYLALGQQLFEQAKLSWYYAIGNKVDLETWDSAEIIQLYDRAEDNMEKGMQMWETIEEQRLKNHSVPLTDGAQLQKLGLDGVFNDVTADEAAEWAANVRSQINLLWGTMLYERSIVEYKLGLPVWHECLEVAVEKFEHAGASPTDIAVMVKNHCSNNTAIQGLGFKIDEIVQAWNDMYEAKRCQSGVPSFRLEPLFRRRIPGLYHALEHA